MIKSTRLVRLTLKDITNTTFKQVTAVIKYYSTNPSKVSDNYIWTSHEHCLGIGKLPLSLRYKNTWAQIEVYKDDWYRLTLPYIDEIHYE